MIETWALPPSDRTDAPRGAIIKNLTSGGIRERLGAGGTAYLFVISPVEQSSSRRNEPRRSTELALDERWWPTVARLRCFQSIDTLSAFALHLELGGDWHRFARAPQLAAWLGPTRTTGPKSSITPAHLTNRRHISSAEAGYRCGPAAVRLAPSFLASSFRTH